LSKGKLVALGATVGGLTGAALLIRKLRSHDEHDDEEYDDEEEDEEDEPRSRHDDEEEDEDEDYEDDDEDEDDEPQARRASSRSHDDDRGLASTLWDAVVEGVRSSQSGRREKAPRGRARDYDDEEDDDSDRKPRGAAKTERKRSATRAPRGNRNGDDGKAMELVRDAKRHLVELTGRDPESVSGVEHDGDGRTRVRLEVVELERIPRTTDVLASYELTLDENGGLVDCTRVGRYTRSSAETGVT
jgi:hypothetical protein